MSAIEQNGLPVSPGSLKERISELKRGAMTRAFTLPLRGEAAYSATSATTLPPVSRSARISSGVR